MKISIQQARELASRSTNLPSARLRPEIDHDDHITAWAWVHDPDDVETFGCDVQVSEVVGGKRVWLTVDAEFTY